MYLDKPSPMLGDAKVDQFVEIEGDPFGIGGGNKFFTLFKDYIFPSLFGDLNCQGPGNRNVIIGPDVNILQPTVEFFAVC